MKIVKYSILLIIFAQIGVIQSVIAQQIEYSPLLRKALIEYQGLRYISAIKELQKVVEKDPENLIAIEMLANSNRYIKNYDESLYWYGELCKSENIKPEWALYYAEALANKQKYEESEQWYRRFLSMKPTDRRANAFSKASFSAIANNIGEYKIKYSNINTDDSEYSPMYYKSGLIFVSNRQQKTRYVFQWDRTSYSDLYILDDLKSLSAEAPDSTSIINGGRKATKSSASGDNSSNSLIGLLSSGKKEEAKSDEPYLLRGKVKSSYHEGPSVLLPEGSLLFTRNNFISGKVSSSKAGVNKLKLFTASGPGWDKISPFPYNNNEYSVGHPALSADGNVLVFSSDMPRGFGGTDLYYCVRTGEGKKWGRPVNLGPKINTEGNEQFPYLHKNGKLYFSSTGHPGLGGLDIFEVVLKDMKAIGTPRNMGADINSSADDFGFILDEKEKAGFFSSNRRGNDDIYEFEHLSYTVKLKGLVIDAVSNQAIPASKVIIRHNGKVDTILTNDKGEFTKVLSKQADYELGGSKLAYVSRQEFISTAGITVDTTLNVVLKLNRTENLQQWVIDNCETLKKNFNLGNIYYDLDKDEIRSDAIPTLDRVAEVMKRNPEISIISASHTDSRANDDYNRQLSMRRGMAARSYLISKGIDGRRIEVQYYGKSRLINACVEGVPCPEEEQQLNRRTEFEVVLHGVNINQLNCN